MEPLSGPLLAWERSLGKLDIEEIRARAKQVAELSEHPAWSFIREIAETKDREISQGYAPPAVHEHARYVALTNQQFGMRIVLEAPEAIRLHAQSREEHEKRAAETAARRTK